MGLDYYAFLSPHKTNQKQARLTISLKTSQGFKAYDIIMVLNNDKNTFSVTHSTGVSHSDDFDRILNDISNIEYNNFPLMGKTFYKVIN